MISFSSSNTKARHTLLDEVTIDGLWGYSRLPSGSELYTYYGSHMKNVSERLSYQ